VGIHPAQSSRRTSPMGPTGLRRRAGTFVTAAAAITAAAVPLAACTAAAVPTASTPVLNSSAAVLSDLPGPGHPAWLLTRPVLAQVISDPAVVARLRGKLVYEILQPGQPPLAGVVAEPVVTFASAAVLKSAVRSHQLPPGVFGVMYDPEDWAFTPASEQQHPVQAATSAAAVAHAHGLRFIVAPAIDLTAILSAGGTAPRWRQFLALGLIGRLAKVADVVDIQAQSLEQNAGVYTTFVEAAAAQASQASPGIGLVAGLSTNPPGAPVDAQRLTAAIQATRSVVAGYWLNVPSPGIRCPTCDAARPQVAIQVLRTQP
jgi:hypothetical protein